MIFAVARSCRCVAFGAVAAVWLLAGCRALDVGSDIVWGTDFETDETDNFSAWQQAPGTGGVYAPAEVDASVVPSTDCAHRGRYGAKLTSVASDPTPGVAPPGSGLFKTAAFPPAAYYSAWYRIPAFHRTLSAWTLLSFNVPPSMVAVAVDGGAPSLADASPVDASAADADPGTDLWEVQLSLSLQSLPPDGRLALFVTDSRHPFLTTPLPENVPLVPIDQWFQIECYLDRESTDAGELRVWLDGQEVYDVQRPMIATPVLQFMPCSLATDLDPGDAEICLDDVIVSMTRVTPAGVLHPGTGP